MKPRKAWLCLLALCAAVSVAGTPAAAQQPPGQISEARRAAIERCVPQAHQEAIAQGPNSGEQQQRSYIQTAGCCWFPAIAPDSRNDVLNTK